MVHPRTTGMAYNFFLCHKVPVSSISKFESATRAIEYKYLQKHISPTLADEVCKSQLWWVNMRTRALPYVSLMPTLITAVSCPPRIMNPISEFHFYMRYANCNRDESTWDLMPFLMLVWFLHWKQLFSARRQSWTQFQSKQNFIWLGGWGMQIATAMSQYAYSCSSLC